MPMFINRQRELEFLEEHYRAAPAEMIILTGRRRTGKTTLLNHFCTYNDKPHIFFVGDFGAEPALRQRFSSAVLEYETGLASSVSYDTWEAIFTRLGHLAQPRRLVVVIDEFPYLIRANAGIPSILQRVWDQTLRHTSLMLILSGSNLSIMRHDVLEYRSPLYGRRTGQWFLQPLAPWDAGQMLPAYNARQQLESYAAVGGIPAYLEQLDARRSVMVNVERQILQPGAPLYEEPRALLSTEMELREPATYYAILRAIATGHSAATAIARAIGKHSASDVHRYLTVLSNGIQLIRRDTPTGPLPQPRQKRSRWHFADPFFAFWFTFVYPHIPMLERGGAAVVLRDHVQPRWQAFVGRGAWESACRAHIWRLAQQGALDFFPARVGRWWDKNHEIDVVAVHEASHRALLGEAKWTTQKVGVSVLRKLQARRAAWAAAAPDMDWDITYILFGRAFTTELRELAASDDRVRLVGLAELMGA